jgi:MerR family transcriptional regulator, light-induced transcriptional regulator
MEKDTNVFSIKELEKFSGIKAHTIRIWEKRYRILEPYRTDSNIRTYNEAELKKILNVAFLNRNGLKISKIGKFDEDELAQMVMTISSKHDDKTDSSFQPGKILMSAIRFNEGMFKESLTKITTLYGLEEAYLKCFSPLLEKTRILWQTGSLSRAQEYFVRNIIRQIIIIEDNLLEISGNETKPIVAMINTSDNLTEINFLFYKYILKKRGYDVIFTGGILPVSEVIEIHKIKPFIYLIVNSNDFDFAKKKSGYFSNIGKSLNIKKIIFTDSLEEIDNKLNDQLLLVKDPPDFIRCIENLR